MFNQLSDNLEGVFKKLRGQGKISEKNVSEALREVRMAMLEADVDAVGGLGAIHILLEVHSQKDDKQQLLIFFKK